MTDTALAAVSAVGLILLGLGWLTKSASVSAVGSMLWALPFARLTADRAARGVSS